MKASDAINRRFVLTGGPGVGKTTLIESLQTKGYECVPEVARGIIKTRLAAGLSPRPSPIEFAQQIFATDVTQYLLAHDSQLVFFDRSAVDSLGMLQESGAMSAQEVAANLAAYPYNRCAFILPPWRQIYTTDGERDQTFEQAQEVDASMRRWYSQCGYDLVDVPTGPVATRVKFLLQATGIT